MDCGFRFGCLVGLVCGGWVWWCCGGFRGLSGGFPIVWVLVLYSLRCGGCWFLFVCGVGIICLVVGFGVY